MEDALSYLTMHNLEGRHQTVDIPKLELQLMHDQTMNGARNKIESTHSAPEEVIAGTDALNGPSDSATTNGATPTRAGIEKRPATDTDGEHDTNGDFQISKNEVSSSLFESHKIGSRSRIHDRCRERIFVLSAYDEAGVQRLVQAYRDHLLGKSLNVENEDTYLDDLSYTLACKRTSFGWRTSIVASSISSLAQALESHPKPVRSSSNARAGFIFTGQGAQWYAMGRELLDYPVFRQSLVDAGSYLIQLGSAWKLMGRMSPIIPFGQALLRLIR